MCLEDKLCVYKLNIKKYELWCFFFNNIAPNDPLAFQNPNPSNAHKESKTEKQCE